MFGWNPKEHTDEENLRWSWLRASEWGELPVFLSQPLVPVLLVYFPWKALVFSLVMINVVWGFTVRYRVISITIADFGSLFHLLKWIACPASAFYLYFSVGDSHKAVIALLWPLIIMPLMFLSPPVQIGRLQQMFMRQLGYKDYEVGDFGKGRS
jgi:hypothetical protein